MAAETVARSWVSKTPGVCGGDPCIRNTRITVHGLIEWRNLGQSDRAILAGFPQLTQADLDVAWQYYRDNRAEIDRILVDEREA